MGAAHDCIAVQTGARTVSIRLAPRPRRPRVSGHTSGDPSKPGGASATAGARSVFSAIQTPNTTRQKYPKNAGAIAQHDSARHRQSSYRCPSVSVEEVLRLVVVESRL